MFVTIIIFIVVLSVIILVHEFGHFFAARTFKVKVEEFGIGFPPRAVKLFHDKKKTLYSLNWLPLGGFVKMKGEQGDNPNDADSFMHASAWKRAIILCAGVFMNIVLGFLVLSAAFMIGSPQVIDETLPSNAHLENQKIQIYEVEPESPAAQKGLQEGDQILALGIQQVTTTKDIQEYARSHENIAFTLTYLRDGQPKTLDIAPQKLQPEDEYAALGIYTLDTADVSYSFFPAIWHALQMTIEYIRLIITTLWTLLSGLFTTHTVPADLVGPVGIAVITGKIVDLGFVYILQFVAIITLNLAVINILPIPALDGGRLLFLGIEKLRGKPLNQGIEGLIHNVGFVVLLVLIGIITIRDIVNIDTIRNLF